MASIAVEALMHTTDSAYSPSFGKCARTEAVGIRGLLCRMELLRPHRASPRGSRLPKWHFASFTKWTLCEWF
jgi:hypothetical protein